MYGIPELLDSGHTSWMLDCGRLTVNAGVWTLDTGF